MILRYFLTKFHGQRNKRFVVYKRSVSLIEILVVMGILIPVAVFFGTNVYSKNRDKIAFKRSYNAVNHSLSLAQRCCVYYGIDVSVVFYKQDGVYVSEIRTVKNLPEKVRRFFSKPVFLKGVSDMIPIFSDSSKDNIGNLEEFSVFFEGTLGGVSVKEIILKRKDYEQTIKLT